MPPIAIYTDLDGTLLDHHTYSHAAADPLLLELEQLAIPVIPCTSKTRAELLPLRATLNNHHPFIIENGAAVLIPDDYFPNPVRDTPHQDGFYAHAFVAQRETWTQRINTLASAFPKEFRSFSAMSIEEIGTLTGLDDDSASRAAMREYGEPVQWLGDQDARRAFVRQLTATGAQVLEGGRFMHVSGACDKGLALAWLNEVYARHLHQQPITIAAGDSQNDIAMLEAADYALIVRNPAHPPPQLQRRNNTFISNAFGPLGWVEGIQSIINQLRP